MMHPRIPSSSYSLPSLPASLLSSCSRGPWEISWTPQKCLYHPYLVVLIDYVRVRVQPHYIGLWGYRLDDFTKSAKNDSVVPFENEEKRAARAAHHHHHASSCLPTPRKRRAIRSFPPAQRAPPASIHVDASSAWIPEGPMQRSSKPHSSLHRQEEPGAFHQTSPQRPVTRFSDTCSPHHMRHD